MKQLDNKQTVNDGYKKKQDACYDTLRQKEKGFMMYHFMAVCSKHGSIDLALLVCYFDKRTDIKMKSESNRKMRQ